jgi:hypothetical protein
MKRDAKAFEADTADQLRQAGAYRFYGKGGQRDGVTFGCPCGCGACFGMSFQGWTVTGEWPAVSATPSLGCRTVDEGGFHWHGFLRDGIFEEC